MSYSWLLVLTLSISMSLAPFQPTCSKSYKNNYFYCKFHYILSDGVSLFRMWRSSHFAWTSRFWDPIKTFITSKAAFYFPLDRINTTLGNGWHVVFDACVQWQNLSSKASNKKVHRMSAMIKRRKGNEIMTQKKCAFVNWKWARKDKSPDIMKSNVSTTPLATYILFDCKRDEKNRKEKDCTPQSCS